VDTGIEGTGIGLTLAKELTELHGGTIGVNSELGKGTEITIKLPISQGTHKPVTNESQVEGDEKISLEVAYQQIENSLFIQPSKVKKSKVLVVEDDPDLRLFIRRELAGNYEVITAKNGEDGLRKAFFKYPDIIISDVMMPVMDGLEFCSIIKNDERTSHTPVILLTARYSEEKHVEGFEAGADDYIYKPFNVTLLKSRIDNLLLQRSKLIENFQNNTSLFFDHEGVDDSNQQLMQSIIDIVLENISKEKINAEFISKRIHISRSLLYLKIEAISGQTVNEFIRSIRLKKAAQLLLQKKMSVTEIAYAVGFSSQPYFSRCFSNMFHVSPSKYKG
jgi:DNA-binding response OmpR family regulator